MRVGEEKSIKFSNQIIARLAASVSRDVDCGLKSLDMIKDWSLRAGEHEKAQ